MPTGLPKCLALAGGALVAALLLTACGDSSDRVALEAMINAAVIETGPESCLKFSTLHFLESTSGLEGKAAIRDCEEGALDLTAELPKKVDIPSVDIQGDSATALVAFHGSVFDGQKIRYALVEREDRWKFNEILGFVDLDAERLILRAGREGMLRAESRAEAENVACWIGRMERMSDEALEALLLEGNAESTECTADSSAI